MTTKIYNLLQILENGVAEEKPIQRGLDAVLTCYGTEYIAQYILPDTFPLLYDYMNRPQ